MDNATLFAKHIKHVQGIYERALLDLNQEKGGPNVEAVLIHSGSEDHYFGDDRGIVFEAFGHFRHWVPLNRPDQMVLVVPGSKPVFFQVVPPDFWYEQTINAESWWTDCFDIVQLDDPAKVLDHLPAARRIAFLGQNTAFASNMSLPAFLHNERHLTNYLDYYRGMKTEYEIAQLKEANRLAMIGHEAARQSFLKGGSEWDIHLAFLNANQMLETDSPYTNIVGLDEKSAILHYQNKRRCDGRQAKVMLIDAGVKVNGYGSDITRTYVRDDAHPTFRSLLAKMEQLELDLVEMAVIDTPYVKIHETAHARILKMLQEEGVLKGSEELLKKKKASSLFFPHGIGHLLGIQVHDVGGFFADDHGKLAPPPEDHKFLRLNRTMKKDMVFTVEPGLYFIPVLLDPQRKGELADSINWSLVDELIPFGGIRIEDNIVVTDAAPLNLTRSGLCY